MVTISCDVCRKKIDNPITSRSFFYFAEFSVCEACRDNLEAQMKPTLRAKEPFAIDWYSKLVKDSLTKAVQKGK
jgi:hypothetical protein